jgi:hypothetical protein
MVHKSIDVRKTEKPNHTQNIEKLNKLALLRKTEETEKTSWMLALSQREGS